MSFNTPVGFYDRYNPLTTKWFRLLFVPGVDLQAAEVNEIQSMIQNQIAKLGGGIFKNGTFLDAGEKAVQRIDNKTVVTINAGPLWADAVHDIDAGQVEITGIGLEIIYLKITTSVLTENEDPTLNDPAEEAENFGYAGAKRLLLNYEYVLNVNTGIPIVTLIDGQIVQDSSHNGFLDLLYKILAQRTREQFGQHMAERPVLNFEPTTNLESNPIHMILYIDNGIAYNQGYRLENKGRVPLTIQRPLTGQQTIEEPHTFTTGTLVYELADGPVTSIDQLSAVIQSPVISMARGLTLNGSDEIPLAYRPVQGVVSIQQGATTYVQGTDFNRSNYTITWLAGGAQPSPGTTYNLVVNYTKDLTRGVRTLTTAANEDHAVAASGNTMLTHADVSKLTSLVNTTTSTTLVEGVDFNLTYGTGAIVWISGHRPATGNNVRANYTWWNHTTEGDFVSRDSFVDSGGSKLYNSTPIKTPTGIDVDYSVDISFDVVGGKVPVNGFDFDVDYKYSLGRVDVLAWRNDGIFQSIPGEPGLTPSPPVVADNYVPIARLVMPPEAIGEEVQIEWYNNLIMKVVEQRQLHQQVQDMHYNVGLNQLLQSAQNIQTDTPKKGIFTDDLSTPLNMDQGHPLFAGTCDFLGKKFVLPRTVGKATPTVTSNTGAILKDDTWFLNYTNEIVLSQTVKSRAETINSYGAVNDKAKVTTNPSLSLINSETLSITMNAQWVQKLANKDRNLYSQIAVTNPMLLGEVSQGSNAAASYGTAATLDDDLLGKIETDADWAQESSTGSLTTNNIWAKVLTELNVIAAPAQLPHTIAVSGTGFRANDRAIQCLFDGIPLAITPTGGTLAETASGYTDCVKANNQGAWTGTITTPANVPNGTHNLVFMAHDVSDLGRITSIANSSFVTGGTSTQVNITITLSKKVRHGSCQQRAAITLCAVLGYKGDKVVTGSINGPIAYTIAYAIDGALKAGQTISEITLVAGISALLTQMYRYPLANLGTIATNLANVCNRTALNNVASNAAAMLAAEPFYASRASGPNSSCVIDPLAQTFSFSQLKVATFVNLYFSTLPTTDSVGVAIAPVENGIPTEDYLAITYKQPSDITSTTGATAFTFEKPVLLDPAVDYAIVILTNDPNAAIWTAAVGDQETGTNTIILVNPSSGVMLKSTDAASWTPMQGHSIKFDIGCAVFEADTPAYLNFGLVTFAQASSIIAFYAPFYEPTQDTKVIYQYSVDGNTWLDFSPLKEQELGGAFTEVYLRIKMMGTRDYSPAVVNATRLQYAIYQSTGNYVGETFATATATSRYAELYATTIIPGNTTLPFYVSYDSGATWNLMTEDTAGAIEIDAAIEKFQRHYIHDSGAANKQNIKFRVGLNTTVNSLTPSVTDMIGLAR